MSNKRRSDKHTAYRQLQASGIQVQQTDQIRLNSGSETFAHEIAKLAVGHIGKANDYWVSSEVDCGQGDIDVVLWGHPDRLTYAVEVETGWTDETKQDKRKRYVDDQTGIDDMLTVEVTEMPTDWMDALGYVSRELGLAV
jgi:hypothetical protein